MGKRKMIINDYYNHFDMVSNCWWVFFIKVYFSRWEFPESYAPTVILQKEKSNAEIVINVTECSRGSNLDDMETKYFFVALLREGQVIYQEKVTALVNNETSNITFYDRDKNNMISVGDKFVVKGWLKEAAVELVLVHEREDRFLASSIKLKE
ncbi:MAG: hypothetical protein AB1485_05615 [Candidatus Thermoplasmatota archaeon]